ncbi:hypothetical protein [Gimesia aquarii]|uniref:Secretin/TonB short N-terminal domain-containing protein n=1 Tax=Gimesia aquarii TaxID=2527964 RepID=A0A517W2K9_9PLAN|nr:hypothetical protein [Gimesia aquarii]QDT99492.1 hypothetical protein V144x_50030 [Gimesia aquarii]
MKIKYLNRKNTIVAVCVLTAGWLVMAVNAEDKKSKKKQEAQPGISPVVVPAAKLGAKQSARETKPIFYPELTKSELKIQQALNTETECDFSESPLSDVVAFLADRHGITLLLLENKMKEEGISLDEPVSLSVKGIALKNVLELILEPIDMTYLVDREVLKITTRIDASEIYQTRVYPVGDFGNTPEVYLELGSTITKHLSLGFWYEGIHYNPFPGIQGGAEGSGFFQVISNSNFPEGCLRPRRYEERDAGTISLVRLSESLVISQTYHAHNEIVELLTQLRRIRALD